MATAADIQQKLDAARQHFEAATSTFGQLKKKYGTADWTKWPTSTQWYQAETALAQARAEVGQLPAAKLTAKFASKEV